ncbi:TPA: phage tail tape measure protein [Escherichia coli]|nr:phage tail tape measure protein [Escherichia coli]
MSQPVGDLIIDLSLDAVRFDEQMSRVRRHFSGLDTDARKTASAVEQGLSRQALAAQKAGISVGQYKAAMRTLPAQFTDIATQLAGGQNPWLILLQQGGQVKDSFGGMIPMLRGLAGAITLPMVGVTSLAVATGALAYAWYQGDSTLSAFNKTLVLSGNQSGLTADRMLTLSRAGQAAGLTFNQASESLAALVNAGVRGGEQFDAINQSVARFASASGVEVDKVAEAFGKLTTDPTSGLMAMARQFRNVTAEQIAYVAQLQRSGDEAGALQAANDIATKGFDEQTRRLKENMGTLETWADKTGKAFKSMWDAILDIGRPESSADIRALATQLPAFRQKLSNGWYQVRIAGRDVSTSGLTAQLHETLPDGAVIHIVPRVAGAKSGGVFQIVLGAAAIAGSFFTAGATLAAWGAAIGAGGMTGILFSLGASMVLGGVAQMLAPKARTPTAASTDNGKQNTYFSSLDNMVAQGNVLPVLYGEMRVGSRVVSQEISTADEGDGGQVVVIGR